MNTKRKKPRQYNIKYLRYGFIESLAKNTAAVFNLPNYSFP